MGEATAGSSVLVLGAGTAGLYVRTHFGNHYRDVVTAAEVRSLDP